MWVIGDYLLNSTIQQFMQWRNNAGKNHYINKVYEVTPYAVMETNNFLIQIQKGLARAINANTTLPEIILVVLSDVIPGDKILFNKHEFYLQRIMQIIKEAVLIRIEQLPKKAKSIFGTKIVITKALPKPEDQEFKLRRRRYNKYIDTVAKQHNVETIHINDILPTNPQMFEGPDLSDLGKRKMWTVISEKIRLLDLSDSEALNKIRSDRVNGTINVNRNTWDQHNQGNPRRLNYLGIQIENRQENRNRALQRAQNDHRRRMDHFDQLNRQEMIRQHISRNNRRFGANGAANWHRMMRFIQNMERRNGEMMGDFQDRVNDAYSRRVNRMFQSGDGQHVDLYNNHQRRMNNEN